MSNQLVIVFGGDSISAEDISWTFKSLSAVGHGGEGNLVLESIHNYRSSDGSLIAMNMAVSGSRLNTNGFPDLVPMAPGYIDPIVEHKADAPLGIATRKYLFVNGIGSNDSALGTQGNVSAYAAANAAATVARKTAGFDLCAMVTLLPRNDGPLGEPNRTAYNALLTDPSWRSANGIDYVVDIASEATMGNPATCSNTTYFVDGVHPTDAGYALLAPIAASVWSAILTSF